MPTLSFYIMAQNEEKRIHKTLKSIKHIADEIIVIDGGSSDRTVEIAQEYTNQIYVHPFEGYAKQRQYALTKVNSEWVFAIDADETLSPELQDAIPRLIMQEDVDAFEFSRRNYIKPGIWLRYGGMYPDYQRRLFRKQKAIYGNIVHSGEIPQIEGNVKQINLDIIHDQTDNNIQYHWKKLIGFVKAEITDTMPNQFWGYYLYYAFVDFFIIFTKKYFLQKAYKMGTIGIRLALSHAIYRFLTNIGLVIKRLKIYFLNQ